MKPKKVRRILGVGHIWFRKERGEYVGVVLGKDPDGRELVPLRIGKLGAYNKVRLVAEILI